MLELTVRLIASLAVVVGLLLLLARFGGRRFRGRSGELVRVVHRQPLSRSSAVAVVSVGSRVLVLGTTEQQVSILTELGADEIDPDLLAADLDDPEQLDGLDAPDELDELDEEILELPAAGAPLAATPAFTPLAVAPSFAAAGAPAISHAPAPAHFARPTSESLFEAIVGQTRPVRTPAAHRARMTHLDEPDRLDVDLADRTRSAPAHRFSADPEPVMQQRPIQQPIQQPAQQPIQQSVVQPSVTRVIEPDFRPVSAPTMNAALAALAALEQRPLIEEAGAAAQLLAEEDSPRTSKRAEAAQAAQAARAADTARAAEVVASAPSAPSARRAGRTGVVGEGPLAGSVLSVATWRQAFAAATGKAS